VVPTLMGRIQTRIFLLAIVGSLVTAIITPVLPLGGGSLGARYGTTFAILAAVLVLGIVWEFIYHFLMQFRWEKDWPVSFALLNAINEGVVVYLVAKAGLIPGVHGAPPLAAFLIDFILVWLAVWFVAIGPMRVPFIRWRFRGGRLI
jgi:hypothetical protein